jgi:hypothetical protein
MIQKVSLPDDWAAEMLELLEKDKKNAAQSCVAFVQKARAKVEAINFRLQKLLDGYLEQDVEQQVYRTEKAKLMSQKKTLEEEIIRSEQKQYDRLEPVREWIILAETAAKIATGSDLCTKKVLARKIFGSNLVLETKKARGYALIPWAFLLEKEACSSVVTFYTLARTALEEYQLSTDFLTTKFQRAYDQKRAVTS